MTTPCGVCMFLEMGREIRMDWFYEFLHMNDDLLRNLKNAIDGGFRTFTRTHGGAIEDFVWPLQ